jgi:IS1 family transposase
MPYSDSRTALEALAKAGEQRPLLEVELDEMRSFVGGQEAARWLWHALDHHTGHVVAYVMGSRADHTFLELKALLAPFGVTRYYSDKWGPTGVISPWNGTPLANATCKRLNASTSHSGHG